MKENKDLDEKGETTGQNKDVGGNKVGYWALNLHGTKIMARFCMAFFNWQLILRNTCKLHMHFLNYWNSFTVVTYFTENGSVLQIIYIFGFQLKSQGEKERVKN